MTDRAYAFTFDGRLSNAETRRLLTQYAAQGCGIFFTLNKCDGKGRKRENVLSYRVLGVDFDGTPLPTAPPIPFHIITESSPGRFHGYFLLQPGDDLAAWSDTMAQVAAYYDADPSCCDPPRVFRLPGSFHQKTTPHRVRMIHKPRNGDVQFDRHALDEIQAAHPCEYKKPGAKSALRSADSPGNFYDNETDIEHVRAVMAKTVPTEGDRNNTAYRLAAVANDFGITPDRALELLHEWNDTNAIGLPDDELAHVVNSASRYKELPAGIKATIAPEDDFADSPLDPIWLPTQEEVEAKLKRRHRFAGMNLSQLEDLPPLQWSIDGLIPKGQLIELYGPPKAGKTFVAIDMGLCIATGRGYHGKRTIKGRVLHIVGEGNKAAIRDRVKAWIYTNGATPKERAELEQAIRENWILVGVPVHVNEPATLKEFFAANPGKFELVAVDTLLRNMAGHISDPQDMAGFVRACDAIRDHYGAAVLVVHHEGKDRSKGGMGSIALDAAVDAILIFRSEGRNRTLTVKEIRDGSSDLPDLIFELQEVTLSVDPVTLEGVKSAALKLTGTQAKVGLTSAQTLLKTIGEHPTDLRQNLAARLGVTPQAISKTAAELRASGYLFGRGFRLTPKGVDVFLELQEV